MISHEHFNQVFETKICPNCNHILNIEKQYTFIGYLKLRCFDCNIQIEFSNSNNMICYENIYCLAVLKNKTSIYDNLSHFTDSAHLHLNPPPLFIVDAAPSKLDKQSIINFINLSKTFQ